MPEKSKNSIFVIHPVRHGGIWDFTDPAVGLVNEPFVGSVNTVLDWMLAQAGKPGATKMSLQFSANQFPGATGFTKTSEQFGGNNYYCKELNVEGWLCPALFKYFPEAPPELWIRCY